MAVDQTSRFQIAQGLLTNYFSVVVTDVAVVLDERMIPN